MATESLNRSDAPIAGPSDTGAPTNPASGQAVQLSTVHRWALVFVLFLVTTSNYFDYYIISIVLEPIKRELHLSDATLGLLTGAIFSSFYALAAIPLARWADLGNRRSVMFFTLSMWSVMTAMCGLAQNVWQFAVARIGVGLSEPGATPVTQSLIADYFPPDRRAGALALTTQWGACAGALLGIWGGGMIAAAYGWRAAFLAAGIPGVALAIVARFVVVEPRLHATWKRTKNSEGKESARQAIARLAKKRTYLALIGASALYSFFSYACMAFLPSYVIRGLGASLSQVSFIMGVLISLANLVGATLGAWAIDRLARRSARWYARLPMITTAIGAILYWVTLSVGNLRSFVILDFVAETVLAGGVCIVFAAIHEVCGDSRRATAIAGLYLAFIFVGGFGPVVAGFLSDYMEASFGGASLGLAMRAMVPILIGSCILFWKATGWIDSERE